MNLTRRDLIRMATALPAAAWMTGYRALAAPAAKLVKITGIKAMAATAFKAEHKCTTAWVKQVF